MNPFFKALVGIIVVAVLAGAGIFYQYRAASAEAVGLTQDEMNLFAEKNLGARDRQQLANDPAKRKDMLEKLGKQLSLVAEANRLGLGATDDAKALDEVTTAQVLQGAYLEAHPELAKGMGPHGGGAPQPAQEEVDAWVKAHGDDVARYQQAVASVSKGMPPMKPENFASVFVFADKARAEGIDQKPETRLQLKLARYGILYQQMDTKLEEQTKYSDDEVKKYYDSHKPTGDLDQVHVQHILFATMPMPSPTDPTGGGKPDEAAKKKQAEEVLQRVKNGEDFGELAKQFSDDPGSKEQGGDLGWSPRFKLVPEFEEAAWKLQPGQVTDLVKTDFGYHIIKMIERKPPEDLTPQTSEQLKDALSQRRFEDAVNDLAKRNSVSLPADFTVTAPTPAELNPMIPGMQAPVPGDEDMGGDDGEGGPPEPEPSAKSDAKKPAAKAAAAPAKKGAK